MLETSYEGLLSQRASLVDRLEESPYCLPVHVQLALCYFHLQYPDLAAGAAYKALLLLDAISDDSDEYHEQAYEGLQAWMKDRQATSSATKPAIDCGTSVEEDAIPDFARQVCAPAM